MQQLRTNLFIAFIGLASPFSTTAAAPNANRFQSLDELDSIIISQTGAAIEQPGGAILPIDRRLRLAQCTHAPIFRRINDRMGAITCEMPHWRIRVPLVAKAVEPKQDAANAGNKDDMKAESAIGTVVIRKGAEVQILVNDPNVSFTTSGLALEDGASGDIISVKAEPFNKEVKARVIDFETVTLLNDSSDEF